MMARWLVRLEGENFDVEEFPYWFPNGDIYAIKEDGFVYLVGNAFEKFIDAEQVRDVALQAMEEMSAVINLLLTSFQRPTLGPVCREDDKEHRKWYVSLSAQAKTRFKMHSTLTVAGEEEKLPLRTQAQNLLSGLHADAHLDRAVLLWSDPMRTWPRLYCILEEIEKYLGQGVSKEGFCSQKERDRFTRTANTSAAGKDARHAHEKFDPPENPMSLSQGVEFIGKLLLATLTKIVTEQATSKKAMTE